MFKIICFVKLPPEQLTQALKGLYFMTHGDSLVWKMDGATFQIVPFKQRLRSDTTFGYKVYFNGSIDGGGYLFDLSLGYLNPKINGIEYRALNEKFNKNDWLKMLETRKTFLPSETRGIYRKGRVGIIVLDNQLVLQIRANKNKSLKLMESLKELSSIYDELKPEKFDLFSFSQSIV